jgi:hypothetical protein
LNKDDFAAKLNCFDYPWSPLGCIVELFNTCEDIGRDACLLLDHRKMAMILNSEGTFECIAQWLMMSLITSREFGQRLWSLLDKNELHNKALNMNMAKDAIDIGQAVRVICAIDPDIGEEITKLRGATNL